MPNLPTVGKTRQACLFLIVKCFCSRCPKVFTFHTDFRNDIMIVLFTCSSIANIEHFPRTTKHFRVIYLVVVRWCAKLALLLTEPAVGVRRYAKPALLLTALAPGAWRCAKPLSPLTGRVIVPSRVREDTFCSRDLLSACVGRQNPRCRSRCRS